jgi:hypothetical protein
MTFMGATNGADNDGLDEDGILGMSPSTYDPEEDLLQEQIFYARRTVANVFGVSYLGYNEGQSKIIFGGYDKNIVPSFSDFYFFPLRERFYWSINITSVFMEDRTVNSTTQWGILDTGTSLTYFIESDLDVIMDAYGENHSCGYTYYGWIACQCDSVDTFQDLVMQINGVNVTFPASSFIEFYYDSYYSSNICLMWIETGIGGAGWIEILMGDSFMRNYYMYHDAGIGRYALYYKIFI